MSPTGLGKYSYCLLKVLFKNAPSNHHFTILHQTCLSKSHDLFSICNKNTTFFPARIPVIGPQREIRIFTKYRQRINDHDLYHCLSSYLPAYGLKIPSIVTVHDLKYLLFPDLFGNYLKAKYYSYIIKRSIQISTHIIAVSKATKKTLQDIGAVGDKIHVITEASTITSEQKTQSLVSFQRYQPYLLFVGENRPHKNIIRILKVYHKLVDKFGEVCPNMIFAGSNFDKLCNKNTSKRYSNKIFYLGVVTEKELPSLYKDALALVYPSLYEGFGLPILEAMEQGTPVITSNCSSMPEVAGEAAILINPYDVDQLYAAMALIIENDGKRKRLAQLGTKRVKTYSWDLTARRILDLHEKILA